MTLRTIEPESPPLRYDESGAIRVGDSHVLLELVVRAFEDGAPAEVIAQRYPTAGLPAIYAAIWYFLSHPTEVKEYLAERERQASEIKRTVDATQGDLSEIRDRLRASRPQ